MQIDSLLIDAFREADEEKIAASAVLYTFDEPRYVGLRRVNPTEDAVATETSDSPAGYSTLSFPDRELPLEKRSSFSYREPWTVPPWTLYVLAPPSGYHASLLRIQPLGHEGEVAVRPGGDDGVLFYFALVQGPGDRVAFETEARFTFDPTAAARALTRAERVGSARWAQLWETIKVPVTAAGELAGIAAAIKTVLG